MLPRSQTQTPLSITFERMTEIMDAGADMLLPAGMSAPRRPELDLMASLLDDAVDLCLGRGGRCQSTERDIAEAREWITLGNVGQITFDEACEWLGVEPRSARAAVLRRRHSPRAA
jgi:hypothetical protein